MFDIIIFGSITQDIFINSEKSKIIESEKDFVTGKGVCFSLGSKINIEKMFFNSGGGGSNTATTFVKQGFKVALCGAVGEDVPGKVLVNELKELGIDTRFVKKVKEKATNHSIVIYGSEKKDRTILIHRGASELFRKDDVPWKKLKTKWIYLAPLSGSLCDIFEDIVNFAYENKIKIAVNPGNYQLSKSIEDLKRIFSKVDVLILNQEEASSLTKVSFNNAKEIFKKIDEICPGIAVMTKGADGVMVSDGQYLYSALPNLDKKIVDTTGAGDSFASGFISDYIRYNGDIEKAIQLGLANSEGNLSEIGAKTGLLDKNSKFKRNKVTKQLCSENN